MRGTVAKRLKKTVYGEDKTIRRTTYSSKFKQCMVRVGYNFVRATRQIVHADELRKLYKAVKRVHVRAT